MRSIIRRSIFFLLLLTYSRPILCTERNQIITQADLETTIQNVDLVFDGRVSKIETTFICRGELLGGKNDAYKSVITKVAFNIETIYAGQFESKEIEIVLMEGELDGVRSAVVGYSPLKISVGDRAVLALNLNNFGTGYNVLVNRAYLFKLQGDKLVPYQDEVRLAVEDPFEIMKAASRERDLHKIYQASTLICMGRVIRIIDGDKPTRTLIVSVEELLKGITDESEIAIDVSDVYEPFNRQKPGYEVMLFLREQNGGFKTVNGLNGYYVLDQGMLSRGHRKTMRMNANQIKMMIARWKGGEK